MSENASLFQLTFPSYELIEKAEKARRLAIMVDDFVAAATD